MVFDDQLDEALRQQPVWVPPAQFADRVAAKTDTHDRPAVAWPHIPFWIGVAMQGTAAAGIAYVGSWVAWWAATAVSGAAQAAVEEYLRVVAR